MAGTRAKVNLSIEKAVSAQARELGLNMSRLAEEAIRDEIRREKNRRWREENRATLESYGEEVDREGLALERHRSF